MKSNKRKIEAGRVPDISEFSGFFMKNDVTGFTSFVAKFDTEELNQVSDAFGWSLLMHTANSNAEFVKAACLEGIQVNHQSNQGLTALMIAARRSDSVSIQHLLENGADPKLADTRGSTALHWAVTSPSGGQCGVETVSLLLKGFPEGVYSVDKATGSTPLMIAARQRRLEEIKCLLRAGARADQRDFYGRTALDLVAIDAMNSDWLHSAKPLLCDIIGSASHGQCTSSSASDETEASNIAWGIHFGHVSALEVLLAENSQLTMDTESSLAAEYREVIELLKSSIKAQKQLYSAACSQSPSLAKELIDSNVVCVHRPDENVGMKPIDWAAIAGAKDTAQLILSSGNAGGAAEALDLALMAGNAQVAKLFLPNQKPSARLLGLAIRGGSIACVQAMLETKAAPSAPSPKKQAVIPNNGAASEKKKKEDSPLMAELVVVLDESKGFTPLLLAASLGHAEICRELLKIESVHLIATDLKGRDPFLVACAAGEIGTALEIVKSIGDKKVKDQDMQGLNCLSLAIRAKDGTVPTKQLETLMINIPLDKWKSADCQGCTPLMHAAEVGRADVVELLLQLGKFNTNVKCRRQKSAADYARDAGWIDVALLLEGTQKKIETKESSALNTTRHSNFALAGLSLARPAVPQATALVAIAQPGVRVENLHPSVTSAALRNFFEAKNIQVKNAAVSVDPITRFSLGFGFLELSDKKELVPALRQNGKNLLGRRLRVYLDEALPLKLIKKWSAETAAELEQAPPRLEISETERAKLIEFIKNPPHTVINRKIAEFLFETAVEAAANNS